MQEAVWCLGEHTFREGIVDAGSVGGPHNWWFILDAACSGGSAQYQFRANKGDEGAPHPRRGGRGDTSNTHMWRAGSSAQPLSKEILPVSWGKARWMGQSLEIGALLLLPALNITTWGARLGGVLWLSNRSPGPSSRR